MMVGLLFRLSIPGKDAKGGSVPDPAFGGQLGVRAIPGVEPEGDVEISHEEIEGTYADGTPFRLRKPVYRLKANPFYGDNIEKRKIPEFYNVQNLWRVELTGAWRMLYTIKGDQIEILCFILDILDHKRYSKKFGYKNK